MRKCMGGIAAVVVMVAVVQTAADAQWTWTPQTGRLINMKRLPKETPELQVEYARSLMLGGDFKRAMRETNKFEDYYGDSDFADDNQFLRGEIRLAQESYKGAAKEFQKVVANYPETDLYDSVIAKQYEIGDLFYERGQRNLEGGWWRFFRKRPFSHAIEIYTMVIDNQPFTDAAAEAQYKIGLCHFTLEEYVEAAYEYQRVIEDYSASDWVDEACYDLARCYYEGSHPPEYDQAPSYLAIRAIDDFKVRYPGDSRTGTLDTMRVEMRERIATQRLKTAHFYEKRRRFEAARIYYRVVLDQFGETQAAAEARAWLQGNPEGAEHQANS